MTTPEQQREWLKLLGAELARRAVRVAWEADEGERAREAVAAELQEMAERLGAPLPGHPLQTDDMSIAEMLACHLLPKHLRPAGLPSEAKIWRQYRARVAGRGGER